MNKELVLKEFPNCEFVEDVGGRELIMLNGKGLPLDEFKTEQELIDYIKKFNE